MHDEMTNVRLQDFSKLLMIMQKGMHLVSQKTKAKVVTMTVEEQTVEEVEVTSSGKHGCQRECSNSKTTRLFLRADRGQNKLYLGALKHVASTNTYSICL